MRERVLLLACVEKARARLAIFRERRGEALRADFDQPEHQGGTSRDREIAIVQGGAQRPAGVPPRVTEIPACTR